MKKNIVSCEYCGFLIVKRNLKKHIKENHPECYHGKKRIYDLETFKKFYKLNDNDIDFFISEYKVDSILSISKKMKIPYAALQRLCKFLDIEVRGVKDAVNLESRQLKIINTCLEKYGTPNVLSKGSEIYEKRNQTVLEKYGVSNVFQIQEIIDFINSDEEWIKKTGVTKSEYVSRKNKEIWDSKTEEERNGWLHNSILSEKSIIKSKQNRKGKTTSKYETQISLILQDLNVNFTTQKLILRKNKRKYFCDFYLEDLNLILEFNGDYWHANPFLYYPDDLVNYHGNLIEAQCKWQRDKEKIDFITNQGYNVCII